MIYVPEVLKARLEDNVLQLKNYRVYLVSLENQISKELDSKARQGMLCEQKDIYYEYESLSKENKEIRETLSLIKHEAFKQKKKRAPKFADRKAQFKIVQNDNIIIPR